MKLYCWRAKGYAEEAFVVAESARLALEATRVPRPTEPKPDRNEKNYDLWNAWFHYEYHNTIIDNMLSHTDWYDLVVLEPGQVAWAERS